MMMRDWEQKMSGARNAGKFVMFFNERDQPKTEVTPFPVNDADKQYQLMDTTATQKIITAHRVTTPLLFGIREAGGFGSNKDEMATGLEIFTKQVIQPYQRMINDCMYELLNRQLPGVTFEIVPNTPLVEQQSAVTDANATGATADVAATALNGAQITSLVDIVMQSAAGAVPVSSAKAIVSAGFPTLSVDQVSAIFADVNPGTLQPSQVIQSAAKKKVEFDDYAVATALIELGEDANDDMILIDAYRVDDEVEHEFTSTGIATPNKASEQDETVVAGITFMTRYRYRGELKPNTREFCRKMLQADKLYTKENIVAMENKIVNNGWGPNGTATYDIWQYKGGGNCHHFWQKEVYMSASGNQITSKGADAQKIAVAKAERMGYKVRNPQYVAKLPVDMPYNGFLPTNPVYGNQ
jgi:hypothetical protein